MEYTFTREGVPETVALEQWAWGVVYDDGTELRQFGEDGVFHQFREIEQAKVEMFVMYHTADNSRRFDIPLAKENKPQIFHFYRNLMLEVGSANERSVRVYVFGWKRDGVASYNYIMPNGNLICADRDIANLVAYGI